MRKPAGGASGGGDSGLAAADNVPRNAAVLDAALDLASRGIFPIRCKPNTKADTRRHGNGYPSTDPDKIRSIFAGGPWNLGAKLPPGLVGLDIDVPKDADDEPLPGAAEHADGIASQLETEHPELQDAWKLRTQSGGLLYVLRLPEGETLPSKVGAMEWVDVRGDGRTYVLVPPSTINGRAYSWLRAPEGKPPLMAADLLERLRATPEADRPDLGSVPIAAQGDDRTVDGNPSTYARGILDGVYERLSAQPKGGRHQATLAEARALGRWVAGYEQASLAGLTADEARDVLERATDANGYRTEDQHACDGTIRDGLRYGMARPFRVTIKARTGNSRYHAPARADDGEVSNGETLPAPPDLALLDHPQDDLGYANSIAHQHYPNLRHHASLGPLVYLHDEGRHVSGQPAIARAHELAILTQRSIAATAQQIDDKNERAQWESHSKALRSRSKREAAFELMLRTKAAARDDELDGHALELNTPDGVLDLRTLDLRPHDPARIYTGVTPARYRPDATHAAWEAVLDLLREDDRADYVQQVFGQAITGRNNRELYILVGPKATGKTTAGEGLLAALGPNFGQTVDPATLLEAGRQRNAGAPRSDLVALRVARLALTSEPNRRARLDAEAVKRFTGGDMITARGVHMREPISFRPAFTVVMLANEVPSADWQDDALLSRLKLVPFEARPPKADPRVREALVDDPHPDARDALFTWAVHGAHQWISNGYTMSSEPDSVRNATRRYRLDNDPFALWAEDRLTFDPTADGVPISELHRDYVEWAGVNGVTDPQRVEALGKWFRTKAEAGIKVESVRRKAGVSWRGVRLVTQVG